MVQRGRRIPEDKLGMFKEPLGKSIKESDLKKINTQNILITVGDVVSLTLRKHGILPNLSIYDGKTERRTMTEFAVLAKNEDGGEIIVENSAGMITCGMFDAVKNALTRKIARICVDGEEDLAVIPCILLSPDNTNIIYGWPGEGMMLITTNDIIRERAEKLWNMMEESE